MSFKGKLESQSETAFFSVLFSSSFSADEESESEGGVASPCSPEIYTGPKKAPDLVYRQKGRPTGLLGELPSTTLFSLGVS